MRIDRVDIFPLLNNVAALLIRIIRPFIQRNFTNRLDRAIRPFESPADGARRPPPARAARLAYFAIYTPVVGHVPCVLPSVTSDAALGNCAVASVFTAIHASVK